jgi:fructose-specific phosphotransferase system IIC component
MKKTICSLLAATTLMGSIASTVHAAPAAGRGGIGGFVIGCCFGLRSVSAWNEGKDLHFREWALIIPFVGTVIAIWNGIDGANGVTSKDLAAQYPGNFF